MSLSGTIFLYSLPQPSAQIVDFAEKPSGDALKAMRVDTTILGLDPARSAAA